MERDETTFISDPNADFDMVIDVPEEDYDEYLHAQGVIRVLESRWKSQYKDAYHRP